MPVSSAASEKSVSEIQVLRHPDGSRPRVLYAEDSTAARIVTTAMLKRMGLDVDAVEDGELALRQAEKSAYDIILLDIEMPVMDGVAAARGIRALGGKISDTPILALSAFLADSTEISAWRDAFDHAVPKPANCNELHRALTSALGARPPRIEVQPAIQGSIIVGLKASLPRGSWGKLLVMAAMESVHYATAAHMAFQAGDADTTKRCAHSLNGLARNFESDDVARVSADIEHAGATQAKVQELLQLANAWHAWAKTQAH